MIDYAIAIDRVMPGAKWLQAKDYATLVATWQDVQPVPEESVLLAAYADWEAEQLIAADVALVKEGSEAQAAAIPNFAHWTEQQGLDWIAANINDIPIDAITNLAEAKVIMKKQVIAIKALWRLCKAFLNHTWPHLEG